MGLWPVSIHDSVYIFSTEGCDRMRGMKLLAMAGNSRGGHNRELDDIKRDQARRSS